MVQSPSWEANWFAASQEIPRISRNPKVHYRTHWWCGIRMQAEALPQPNHNITPTPIEPEQYNPWNNSTNKSQAPEDGCINIRNMLSIK